MNEWIPHPDSSSLLIYDECNSCPHMCSCYRPYSSHLTLRSDTSEGDLWLCPWMEAKEGEVLSHCPLRLIFNPGQGLFHPPSLTVFYWTLPKKKWVGDDGPPQFKNGTGGGQMSDVWDGVKKKERNRKCRGQEEKAGGTGWTNGGERRGTYSR